MKVKVPVIAYDFQETRMEPSGNIGMDLWFGLEYDMHLELGHTTLGNIRTEATILPVVPKFWMDMINRKDKSTEEDVAYTICKLMTRCCIDLDAIYACYYSSKNPTDDRCERHGRGYLDIYRRCFTQKSPMYFPDLYLDGYALDCIGKNR